MSRIEQAYGGKLPDGAVVVNDGAILLASGDYLGLSSLEVAQASDTEYLLPRSPKPRAADDCLADYQCWFEHSVYGGEQVVVYDPNDDGVPWTDVPDGPGDLDFRNEMSSWRNHDANQDALWAKGAGGNGAQRCMDDSSRLSYVGDTDNDTMNSMKVYAGPNHC